MTHTATSTPECETGQFFPAGIRGCLRLTLLVFLLTAQPLLAAGPDDTLRTQYRRLKTNFENLVQQDENQTAITCLAVETAAMSWGLAMADFQIKTSRGNGWAEKVKEFENSWAVSEEWESRHLRALEFYHEAFETLVLAWVADRQQTWLQNELNSIQFETASQLADLDDRPDNGPEKRVILSGALASLMGVAVKSIGGATTTESVRLIMEDTVAKARAVGFRTDLHFRGRMSLLYAANLQSLTSLTFLLGRDTGPPLNRELAVIHSGLNQHGPDGGLPRAICLTWTAQAQASVPLAYWLVTHFDIENQANKANQEESHE